MEIVLYYAPNTCALAPYITLTEASATFQARPLNMQKNQHRSPDYLKLNPQALVPTLADGADLLTQSLAIVEYLDETHPEPPLLPKAPLERARVRSLAQMVACDIHPIDNLRVLRYLAKPLGHDEKAVEQWFNHWIKLGFDAIEARLAREPGTGRFCHGDRPGLADICLVPQVVNAKRYPSFDFKPYPTITRVFEACRALPAIERAFPQHQPDAEP